MRFLRMLSNSLLAGAFGSAYLTILVLQLNPEVPLVSATTGWWFATFGMLYGLHFAIAFYVAMMAREFFTMDVLSPGWVSVRLLAWLGALLAAGAALLMWLNLRALSLALTESAEWRMTAGAAAATVSAAALLAIAIAHYSFGRRGSRVGATLFVLAIVASITLPLAARGPGTSGTRSQVAWRSQAAVRADAEEIPRVTLLLLDGGSLEYIWPRAAEGRLPNFSRLLDGGAVVDLATVRPTQAQPVWAAVATGMYPASNGVRSAARYFARRDRRGVDLLPIHTLSHLLVNLGFVRDLPLTSIEWQARPLWSMLSDAGVSAGVVRWPLTHPAHPVDGFVVSDRMHELVGSIREFPRTAFPPGVLPAIQRVLSSGPPRNAAGPQPFEDGTPEEAAMRADLLYSAVGEALRRQRNPHLFVMRYEGTDIAGHHYYPDAWPGDRGATEDARRRQAQVVDRYYAFIDGEVGAALARLEPGDLLLVVSGFGMERVKPLKRWVGRLLREPESSGTHERAPDGFLLAYGSVVEPGRRARGSIVDVTSTLLYFFGLPVARDMEGYARADLFKREFSAERPVTFIPSYR